MSIFTALFWNVGYIVFGIIFSDFFKLVNLTFVDYILFVFLAILVFNISWIFLDEKFLEQIIVRGELNSFLYRPGNRFLNYLFSIKFNTFIFGVVNIFTYIPLIIYFADYTFKYFLLILSILFLLLLLNTALFQLINSISFFSLKFSTTLFNTMYAIDEINMTYTPLFFKKTIYISILAFFQVYYVAGLMIPLFKGIISTNFIGDLILLCFMIILLILTTLILWHFGLKKYEGYN